MRHFILSAATAFLAIAISFAQTSVSTGHPALDIKVKRCFVNGNNCYVDLVMTVSNEWSLVSFHNGSGNWATQVFDDEGNHYSGDRYYGAIMYEYDGQQDAKGAYLKTARDIPRKVRLIVPGIDEYAASLKLIVIPYQGGKNHYRMEIKDVPISRD